MSAPNSLNGRGYNGHSSGTQQLSSACRNRCAPQLAIRWSKCSCGASQWKSGSNVSLGSKRTAETVSGVTATNRSRPC